MSLLYLVNPCLTVPCLHGGICDGGSGVAVCDCGVVIGYDGVTCSDDINECDITPSLCEHDGICSNTVGSFTCDCTATDYIGNRCITSIYKSVIH